MDQAILKEISETVLNKTQTFNLIQVANIESGLLSKQRIVKNEEFDSFTRIDSGIPILIPADKTIFEFSKSDIFEINPKKILEVIYNIEKECYVGYRHAFSNNRFISNYKLKNDYLNIFNGLVEQNKQAFNSVKLLKKTFKKVGAFQTRNIPHKGHELIINRMLDLCDHVVINPVLGPKKNGDVNLTSLEEIYAHLINTRYKDKISFMPIYANMFYAGPREAIHHAIMRRELGFDFFSVGRDHAGAEGVYLPEAASETIEYYKGKLGIEIMQHKGAKYCDQCKGVILDGDCRHNSVYLSDISGSDFRNCLKNKIFYPLADEGLQEYVFSRNLDLFEP